MIIHKRNMTLSHLYCRTLKTKKTFLSVVSIAFTGFLSIFLCTDDFLMFQLKLLNAILSNLYTIRIKHLSRSDGKDFCDLINISHVLSDFVERFCPMTLKYIFRMGYVITGFPSLICSITILVFKLRDAGIDPTHKSIVLTLHKAHSLFITVLQPWSYNYDLRYS
jgi:hypothetical protein